MGQRPIRSGLPRWLSVKECTCQAGNVGSIPGSGRSPGEETGHPFQYSCLENPHGQRSIPGYSPRGSQRVRQDLVTNSNNSKPTKAEKSVLFIAVSSGTYSRSSRGVNVQYMFVEQMQILKSCHMKEFCSYRGQN